MNNWLWLAYTLTIPFWFGALFVGTVRVIELIDKVYKSGRKRGGLFDVWEDYLDWLYHMMGGEGRFQ